jgi:hypothetical protein
MFLSAFSNHCTAATAATKAPPPPAMPPLTVYTKSSPPPAPALAELPLKQSVEQYGITWTFAKPAPVGQFINGDWYVVGPVTVVQIDPEPQYGKDVPADQVDPKDGDSKKPVDRRVRNGSMLNIPPQQDVAWDSAQKGCFNGALAAHLPIEMKPTDSLASSISYRVEDTEMANGQAVSRRTHHDNCPSRLAALLTCVSEPLPADAFRPGYCDRSGKIYLARDLKRELLPTLPPFDRQPDALVLAMRMQKPWINVGTFGFDEPMENIPGHYGQMICQDVGDAGLVLCTSIAPEKKERLLVNLVQVGIDYWGAIKSGHPGWVCWGGHGSGRKFTIVFAGALLGDDAMANVSASFPKASFGEDEQTAYGDCFTGAKVVFTGHSGIDEATGIGRDFARQGNPWGPYEHKHPSTWNSEQYRSEAYRRANTSACWVAEALVLRIMHLEPQWHHDAFFDYVDRWMNEDDVPVRAETAKSCPSAGQKNDLTDPRKDYCHEGYSGERWVRPVWDKYRTLSPAPQDGWRQQHDDSYYRNAIALEPRAAK